jgi:hypothetical protein
MFPRLPLLLALALVTALLFRAREAQRPEAALAGLPAEVAGQFTADSGWFPGEPLLTRGPVRAWGSWSGNDDHRGRLLLGPFPAPARLQLAAGGYPARAGNLLAIELAETGERRPVDTGPDIGERWRVVHWETPVPWQGRPVRIIAVDEATGPGGWLAVTEPLRGGRGEGSNALTVTLAGFAWNGLLLFLLWHAAVGWLGPRSWFAAHWLPLAGAGVVAAAAYGVFWAYFAHPWLGRIAAGGLLAGALVLAGRRAAPALPPEARLTARLAALIGCGSLALLHLFPSLLSFDDLAANRFRERMPSDNVLPFDFASRLHAGLPPTHPLAEWQSSDRPPLQAGWELLTWGAGELAGLDARTASGTAAVWFQLLWVPAAYGLLRTLGVRPARAAGWTAALALTGFCVQHTTFTWPKLSSAAFLLGAWAQWFAPPGGVRRRRDFALGATGAALAWLSHGGAAFSLLALAPAVLRSLRGGEWRGWTLAAGVFLTAATPWLAYQRLYEPPANRLLKWHLAGAEAPDPRGLGETLRAAYAGLTWSEIAAHKAANFGVLFAGNWRALGDFSAEHAPGRRHDEFFFLFRTLTWWHAGTALLLAALLLPRGRAALAGTARLQVGLLLWCALTLILWCLLMFTPQSTVIHQGSLAVPLVLFLVLSRWSEAIGGWSLPLITGLQLATLVANYARPNEIVTGPTTGLPLLLVSAAGLVAVLLTVPRGTGAEPLAAEPLPPPAPPPRRAELPPAPVAEPGPAGRRLLLLLLGLAALLALRKPDALLNPQLWAEDGSVFLVEQEQGGAAAILQPYMGYLHLLPRLTAWSAAQLLDPAWWPAWYNGIAFLVWCGVLARTLSPRLPLPHRPWLALAVIAGPQTGEILGTITNAQWVTALLLVQQTLLRRPETTAQRAGDLLLVAGAGLTGPFAAALLPLFAWKWWRERDRDALAALLVAGAAAAWQLAHLLPTAGATGAPGDPLQALVIVTRRLLIWPFLGTGAAHGLPHGLIAGAGIAAGTAFLAWALRPHPRREVRLRLLGAAGLLLAAGVLRTRPDTWPQDDLIFADRYFFLPRLLLVWLVILELDAVPRLTAWGARLALAAFVLLPAPRFILPAAPDFRWREHCAPIRAGTPARIPILPEDWILDYPGRPPRSER